VIGPGVIAPDSLLGGGDAGQRGRCSRVGARGGIRSYDAEARVFFSLLLLLFPLAGENWKIGKENSCPQRVLLTELKALGGGRDNDNFFSITQKVCASLY